MTTNGLKDYPKTAGEIIEILESAISNIKRNKGHLGDVVSGLRSTETLIRHYGDKIWKILEDQKSEDKLLTN